MVATFFCKAGHLVTVPLEQHKTVTAQWYTEACLPKIFDAWIEHHPNDQLHHLQLHHDNVPVHTAIQMTDLLVLKSVWLLHHPPYSPHLAPANSFLFGYVKEQLCSHDFTFPQTAVTAYKDAVNAIPLKMWHAAFDNWFVQMSKCVNNGGDYVH